MMRHRRSLELVACVILLPGLLAEAQVSPAAVALGAYPDIAVDATENIHLVYVHQGRLKYRLRDNGTGVWSGEQDTGLEQGLVHRSEPEIAIDSGGRPHVLVGSSYAYRDGMQWHQVDPQVARDTALAIDALDNVYVIRRGGHAGGHLGLLVRKPGAGRFDALPDPDVANGLPLGRNDHVYGQLVVSPADGSLHIVYRHAAPLHCSYRVSTDGGRTWAGAGIADDDSEAPSLTIAPNGRVFVVTGTGDVFRRDGGPDAWTHLGRALVCGKRDLPTIAVDAAGRVFVACFGGRMNVLVDDTWLDERSLSRAGQKAGFAELAASPDGRNVYVAWEEGATIVKPMKQNDPVPESEILVRRIETVESVVTRSVMIRAKRPRHAVN